MARPIAECRHCICPSPGLCCIDGRTHWRAHCQFFYPFSMGTCTKSRRTLIDYGNGVRTIYEYAPLTFRLVHLLTRRNAITFPDDCPRPHPVGWPGCQVQNLHYTYDA